MPLDLTITFSFKTAIVSVIWCCMTLRSMYFDLLSLFHCCIMCRVESTQKTHQPLPPYTSVCCTIGLNRAFKMWKKGRLDSTHILTQAFWVLFLWVVFSFFFKHFSNLSHLFFGWSHRQRLGVQGDINIHSESLENTGGQVSRTSEPILHMHKPQDVTEYIFRASCRKQNALLWRRQKAIPAL